MTAQPNRALRVFLAGIGFTVLWPSAATATKIALANSQPLVISVFRFFIGGLIMLGVSHGIMRQRLPSGKEWKQLAIYGLLNISLYLGIYIIAMQYVSAGLGSLAIATNPVFISIISGVVLKKRIGKPVLVSLVICLTGVFIAAWPLFAGAQATPGGIVLLLLSMLIYSLGVIYFSETVWNKLDILTINGWQTLLGGLFLLPFACIAYDAELNGYTTEFWMSVLWLATAVSIAAVQLWLYLLRDNPVKASFWLFFCPLAGFLIAWVMVGEPITGFTIAGMVLVIAGLYLVQRRKTA